MSWVSLRLLSLALSTASMLPTLALAYAEAPMLTKLVQEKKLEPVEMRLPETPQVIKPIKRVGVYGGSLRSALRGSGDFNAILRLVGPQNFVRWSMDFNGVEANLAESYQVNGDASVYTFRLRKGMRWSDGTPFTADDVLFAMNDLVANKQFYPNNLAQFTVNDSLVEVSKLDDYTVRFKFAGPYISFLEQLAMPLAQQPVLWQKKYCSQFHPKYNPQIGDLLVKEKLSEWTQLMRSKCGDTELAARWANSERPTLDPWVVKEPYVSNATKVILERNPYFWQVDSKGQQLPYIDRLQLQVMSDPETIMLAVVNGQLDFQLRHISNILNRQTLEENQAHGGYKVLGLANINANALGLWLNHSTNNEKLKKLIRNKDFRIALSEAVDRKEINDKIFLGQAAPWQMGSYISTSKWYNAKLGSQYIQHDVKNAGDLLDKLGLNKRDAAGFRTYPEGGRVSMNVIVAVANPSHVDILELIQKQWAKAGIELLIQPCERATFYARAFNNQYDISADVFPGGMDASLNPRAYLAFHPQESRMSMEWTRYYASEGKSGERPSLSMEKRLSLYDKWKVAKTQDAADKIFKEILQESADEFEMIGTVRPALEIGIRKDNLMNVYEQMPSGWTYPTPAPSLPQQWFFAK